MNTEISRVPDTGANRGLNVLLWVVQLLLGAAFILSGLAKFTQPADQLVQTMAWTADVPLGLVRFIGLAELLGGIGLVIPAATRVLPALTGSAGVGLLLIMVLAAGFHASRGEYRFIGVNVILGGLAAFVAWGRLLKAPITPRIETHVSPPVHHDTTHGST